VVVGGQVQVGPDAIAGEWGHNPLPWMTPDEYPGPECWCGLRGCIETFLSGPALAKHHFERTGKGIDAAQIAELSLLGDATARATMDAYVSRLARALATIINVLDPHAIVL